MTCHANQQPLPYVRLNRVYQLGDTCKTCSRELPQHAEVIGDRHGFYCNPTCQALYAASRKRHEIDYAGFICLIGLLALIVLYVLLGVH